MRRLIIILALIVLVRVSNSQSHLRINQLGYTLSASKVAVFVSSEKLSIKNFTIKNALTNEIVHKSSDIRSYGAYGAFKSTFRLKFTDFKIPGRYYIESKGIKSPVFRIDNRVYDNSADYILKYLRQQRCGYNTFYNSKCHQHDGKIIYHTDSNMNGKIIDVKGGWHDASDYLQYVTTTANTVYQMLFAYKNNPEIYGDYYKSDGNKGANGIPDILDEALWGLKWLVKMNPSKKEMYNQLADDRDHIGYKLPANDNADYGMGKFRPVYFCSGKPQGLFKYKNKSTGIASTAGKYASAFALGAELFKNIDKEFSNVLQQKAIDAYIHGKNNPGVCQTAPCSAPYYYAEDNWVDDMELAAIELYKSTNDNKYLEEAVKYGRREKVTPWMGADTANHYQWYPFLNLGHFHLSSIKSSYNNEFNDYFRSGIEKVYNRGENNAFLMGVPFIWCSNNLTTAIATQAHLYRKLTDDNSFREFEQSMVDWLFGCNPWGTSMIIGLPHNGDWPEDVHSAAVTLIKKQPLGGLVDGPVYGSIFNRLKGIHLKGGDEYSQFQSDLVVYHDDNGDYSTNEPTMDGTASLSYLLSALQKENNSNLYSHGAIIRKSVDDKTINIVFTAHNYSDGYKKIQKTLKKRGVKASFFFTGDFFRNKAHSRMIKTLIKDGHYVGCHSDKHLLYAPWNNRDSTLISESQFKRDIDENYKELGKFGITKANAPVFLPPFEWHNNTIAKWSENSDLTLVNITPGLYTNADYTIPDMGRRYLSSDKIYKKLMKVEEDRGLNGSIMLIHFGTDSRRKDKFYNRLDDLISELENKGYSFTRIDEKL